MTDAQCTVADCGRPSDAFLCGQHQHHLEIALAELPALLAELDITRTRTDRIAAVGNRAHRNHTSTDDTPCWCGCATADPHHHLSHHGHHHEPATRTSDRRHARPDLGSHSTLPIAAAAADAHSDATTVLTTWARHLAETRGANVDLGERTEKLHGPAHNATTGCPHPSCAAIRADRERPPLLPRLALWLYAHIRTIRLDEAAGELHHQVLALHAHIRRVVDRPADRVYAGPCGAKTMTGPCTLDLYAPAHVLANPDSDAVITCDGWNTEHGEGCGAVHARTERRTFLLDALETHVAPVAELLTVLCQLLPAPEPPRRRVWDWRNRGDIPVVGIDRDGVELVSAADLASALRRYQPVPQRAPRRAGVA